MIPDSETVTDRLRAELEALPRLMRIFAAAVQEGLSGGTGSPSMTQIRVLKRLGQRPWLATELAQDLNVTAPTMSTAIDSLVRRGLVERGEAPQDRRSIPLRLTGEGRLCYEMAQERITRVFMEIVGEMDVEDQESLLRGLRALSRAMDSRSSTPCSPAPGLDERDGSHTPIEESVR